MALLFAAPAGLLAAGADLPQVVERWRTGDWQPTDIYPQLYGPAGSAFNWISEHGGAGTTVSFDAPTFVAPLFGWHGRNRVVYAASLGDHDLDGLPIAASSRSWQRFLERERVDWLVIWRDWWETEPPPDAAPALDRRPPGGDSTSWRPLATAGAASWLPEPSPPTPPRRRVGRCRA